MIRGKKDRNSTIFIAPKASAEGACIFSKLGYYGACMMGYYDCALRVSMERVWWVTLVYGIWVIRASGKSIRMTTII